MQLQDLSKGEKLVLEAKWGGMQYNIDSCVEIVESSSILVAAYEYGGNIVDFGAPSFKGILINLYVNDHDGRRYFWPSVNLKVVKRQGKSYYEITTSTYKQFAKQSDRRDKDRVRLDLPCTFRVYNEDNQYKGIVHDLSQSGLAFCFDKNMNIDGKLVVVDFSDYVNGHEFTHSFKVRKVRTADESGQTLYGCRIVEASKDALMYLYLKDLYLHKLKKKTTQEE